MRGGKTKKWKRSAAPRSPGISKEELCNLTGLTDRRHRQIAEAGYFAAPVRGVYRQDAIPGMFRYLREMLTKKDDSLKVEQHKLARVKRETAETELAVLRGELLQKEDVAPALRNVALHQRATLQAKLERELPPRLTNKTAPEALAELRAAVDEICRVFREGTRQWMESPP